MEDDDYNVFEYNNNNNCKNLLITNEIIKLFFKNMIF